jgi:L-alanine-DL-glutamate epimerase-like enolase superfamily enzyme
MQDTLAALEQAASRLDGRKITCFHSVRYELLELLHETPSAATAVDVALYDAFCKTLDVSVLDFLGKKIEPLETSVTIGIKEEDEVRKDVEEYFREGFRILKVKIGIDVDHDISIVRKISKWGKGQVRIRVDGNEGYSPNDLRRFLSGTHDVQLEFVEQPFKAPAQAALSELTEKERSFCMADEDLKSRKTAIGLVAMTKPYGLWNIKLMKSGGITNGKWIADLAGMYGIPLMWGCMDESRTSITAALHTAYASASTRYLDLDGSFDLARDIVQGGFEVQDGVMIPTGGPGLGIELLV